MKLWEVLLVAAGLLTSQANAQNLQLLGSGATSKLAASTYQGPGDVVSGWTAWGSCARVYTVAQASTSTSLCDLVDVGTGAVSVCTLRGSSTGFVDLTNAYCTGSLTPAAACAAVTSCRISKLYDQTGHSNDFTQATNSSRPDLTFSALNGLPAIDCTGRTACRVNTPTFSGVVRPYNFMVVVKPLNAPGGFPGYVGFNDVFGYIGRNPGADQALLDCNQGGGGAATPSNPENTWYAMQLMCNDGTSDAWRIDSSDNSASMQGNTTASTGACQSTGGNDSGSPVMECAIMANNGTLTSTQRGNLNTNAHGTSGYNF